MMNRRTFLKLAGASAASLGTVGVTAAEYDTQPRHVTIEYESVKDELLKYRPLLDLSEVAIRPDDRNPIYAWKHSSPEWDGGDTVYYSYWIWYSDGQRGVSDADSHVPDREPVVVEVDEPSGDVKAVHYDTYHYLVGSDYSPTIYRQDGQQSPAMHVIEPWHNLRPSSSTERGELLDLSDMDDVYEAWLANGWEAHRLSVLAPEEVKYRGNWWADSALGFNFNGALARAGYRVKQTTGFDPLGGFLE